jgi:hypothetical protein
MVGVKKQFAQNAGGMKTFAWCDFFCFTPRVKKKLCEKSLIFWKSHHVA